MTRKPKVRAGAKFSADRRQGSEDRPYVDRYGRRLSAAVMTHWSAAALRAMGVRPADDGTDAEAGQ